MLGTSENEIAIANEAKRKYGTSRIFALLDMTVVMSRLAEKYPHLFLEKYDHGSLRMDYDGSMLQLASFTGKVRDRETEEKYPVTCTWSADNGAEIIRKK